MKLGIFAICLVCEIILVGFRDRDDVPQTAVIKHPFHAGNQAANSANQSNQILYHGGPVMNQSNSVYIIYYGTGFAATTQPIINDFLSGLNGSAEYGVNGSYNAGPNTPAILPTYTFTASTPAPGASPSGSVYWDSYSQGSQLGSNTISKIVAHAIQAGLPSDANGVYLVVTSPDVKVSGFCNSFCAYHTHSTISLSSGRNLDARYALIPDPTQRCSACNGSIAVYGDTVTPNGDMGADTMTDDIMHELSETVTDPDISAWYTQNGAEDGDLCNYVYGPVQTGVNSAGATYHYNALLPTSKKGTRPYLIQQIWKNSGAGYCASN